MTIPVVDRFEVFLEGEGDLSVSLLVPLVAADLRFRLEVEEGLDAAESVLEATGPSPAEIEPLLPPVTPVFMSGLGHALKMMNENEYHVKSNGKSAVLLKIVDWYRAQVSKRCVEV